VAIVNIFADRGLFPARPETGAMADAERDAIDLRSDTVTRP
jgi:hypothetical protein